MILRPGHFIIIKRRRLKPLIGIAGKGQRSRLDRLCAKGGEPLGIEFRERRADRHQGPQIIMAEFAGDTCQRHGVGSEVRRRRRSAVIHTHIQLFGGRNNNQHQELPKSFMPFIGNITAT